MAGVFPVTLRRGPGVVPMGSAPHGSHAGVTPGPHRCRTGPAAGGGDRFDGCNPRDTSKIQSCFKLRLPVHPTVLILARCRALGLTIKQGLTYAACLPAPRKRTNLPDEPFFRPIHDRSAASASVPCPARFRSFCAKRAIDRPPRSELRQRSRNKWAQPRTGGVSHRPRPASLILGTRPELSNSGRSPAETERFPLV